MCCEKRDDPSKIDLEDFEVSPFTMVIFRFGNSIFEPLWNRRYIDHVQICLRLSVKYPAYERLLIDCIKGDLTLFARQDGVEAMWSIVDPIVNRWESIIEKEGRRWYCRS